MHNVRPMRDVRNHKGALGPLKINPCKYVNMILWLFWGKKPYFVCRLSCLLEEQFYTAETLMMWLWWPAPFIIAGITVITWSYDHWFMDGNLYQKKEWEKNSWFTLKVVIFAGGHAFWTRHPKTVASLRFSESCSVQFIITRQRKKTLSWFWSHLKAK